MKDAKGHGSDARGAFMGARNAELQASGPRPVIAGKPEYGTVSAGAAKVGSIAAAHGISTGQLAPGGRFGYNPEAVSQAIASSNRSGRRIGGREAKMIHALLKGRG